ncbi:hypothetical protein [uncultured Bilophila sp.]|uniref:hypothetical protein n=1 Tax=uncultured Bilophila sp. TaxID=529385 RepID=UPI00260AD9E6|nr:hypothetical protein [uncultured Bilophila sp.]
MALRLPCRPTTLLRAMSRLMRRVMDRLGIDTLLCAMGRLSRQQREKTAHHAVGTSAPVPEALSPRL